MSLDNDGTIVPFVGMEQDAIITEIEAFAQLNGIAPATVTSRAVGNSRLYGRLKNGGSCTVRIATQLRNYIKKHADQPKGDAA